MTVTADPLVQSLETAAARQGADKAPAGWEPYAEHSEQIGSAIVRLPRPGATHRDLLISSGFDPDEWQIAGPVNTRRWMRYDQEWLYYYKFDVIGGESPEVRELHVDDLTALIRRRRRPAPAVRTGGDAWAYWASDWQLGKREGENGTPQTVDRVLESLDLAEAEIKSLRRRGRMMPQGVFFGLGDILEGTCGFYPGMSFLIDANRRTQNRLARELITHALDRLLPLFDTMVVGSVAGNHGENRSPKGERITDLADNDDVAVFEAVKEAFDRAGEDRIDWVIPEAEKSLALTLGGVEVGVTHGDLFKGGLQPGTIAKGAHQWWTGQDFGYQEVRGTQVLVSAHFHHWMSNTYGHRTHHQTPAMDPGSQWVTNITGEAAPAAVLTMRFDDSEPLGFADLALLSPRWER